MHPARDSGARVHEEVGPVSRPSHRLDGRRQYLLFAVVIWNGLRAAK
jgi:hypothetical protein